MSRPDERDREIAALRLRLSRLSQASLRINESLDVETVLQGVLDSARSLTEARYGVILLLDDDGGVEDFLSSGMTTLETSQLWEVPGRTRFFEYLGSIEQPLRVVDLLGLLRSMGLPELRTPLDLGTSASFLASPVVHRGERVGYIYLAKKERREEFTAEDEETLVMFASQAALVMANARRYRDEQQARLELENLVNTSPVGVVVFDTRTGACTISNREATRMVDSLREPGQSLEDLLAALTYVRADGRKVRLEPFRMTEPLGSLEPVRAEEIIVEAPNGRSVRLIVNASPIYSDQGQIESLAVTLQDMAPLEDLERLRAEFLGMVSHELRTPLATIKGSTTTLASESADMDPAVMDQFLRIIDQQVDHMQDLVGDLLDVARVETGTLSVSLAPCDVAEMVDGARSRFGGESKGNNLHMDLSADLPPVLADRRRILQVIANLLSNAARYSPQGSPITLTAVRDGIHVAVSVADQGQGLSRDQLPHLFRKFRRLHPSGQNSTAGSGLGLAISKGIVEAHGGRIWADSEGPGRGARFTFTIPTVPGAGSTSTSPSSVASRTPGDRMRVLAVDDDPQALRYISHALTTAGYAAIATGDPGDVPRLMKEKRPHLVLLDLMLPGRNGIQLMKDILKTDDVPVIFVSAYGQEETIAKAFDMGASDYVVKPFSPTELTARIRAALRKGETPHRPQPTEPYTTRKLRIDYASRNVTLAGRPVQLTATEYKLIYELSLRRGTVLTHDQLLHSIWGPQKTGEPWLVRDIVKRIRRKLGDDANDPTYIFTEPRVGYRMASQNDRSKN